jgi:hypothetical protein
MPPEVPPAIVAEESATTPPADPPSTTPPPPEGGEHAGLGGFATAAAQTGAGAGIALATSAVRIGVSQVGLAVPAAQPVTSGIGLVLSAWSCCAMPGAIGYVETWLGDALGQDRAGALIPILAGYGGCAIGAGVSVVLTLVALVVLVGAAVTNPVALIALLTSPAGGAVFLGIGIAIDVLNALIIGVAPAIAYGIVSEKKQAGDVGEGMPGLMEPSRPVAATPVVTRRKPGPMRTAMAF